MPTIFTIRPVPLVFLLALCFTALLNWPVLLHLYHILSKLEHVKPGFALSIPIVLVAALNLVFIPFSLRYLFKPCFAFLFIAGAIVSVAMLKYRVLFDQEMIQNIFETNQNEAGAYLSPTMISWVFFTGILPAILLFFIKIDYATPWYRGILPRILSMLASLAVLALVAGLYYKDYASVGRNNRDLNREIVPISALYGTGKYLHQRYLAEPIPYTRLGEDAVRPQTTGKPTLMFLVIGETARSKNFSMNGYHRQTNPFTSQIGNLISFTDVHSCGTATAISLPCMFSNLGRSGFDSNLARHRDDLLDVLQKSGVAIFWKENDGGCKGVCDRVPNMTVSPKEHPALCDGETCHDEVLLQGLEEEIGRMQGDKLVIFHLIGSHGPAYYQRYPDAHRIFLPDCRRSDIENCSNEALINTYDNSIHYTDHVIAELITRLQRHGSDYQTALLYVSDHGESLGEMGLYLHGTPYRFAPDEQTRVPLQLWLSAGFIQQKQVDLDCLRESASAKRFSHDNLFPSLLGIWDVTTRVYRRELDLFAPCRPG